MEFATLQWEKKIVTEYTAKFTDLSQFGKHLLDTEKRKAQRFKDGLDSEILKGLALLTFTDTCLLYTSPSPRDGLLSRMPSSA